MRSFAFGRRSFQALPPEDASQSAGNVLKDAFPSLNLPDPCPPELDAVLQQLLHDGVDGTEALRGRHLAVAALELVRQQRDVIARHLPGVLQVRFVAQQQNRDGAVHALVQVLQDRLCGLQGVAVHDAVDDH